MARMRKRKYQISSSSILLGVAGLIGLVLGAFLLAVAHVPEDVGALGRKIYDYFLRTYFGKVTLLPGVYLLVCGLALLLVKRKWRVLIGITCLLIVFLFSINQAFPTDRAKLPFAHPVENTEAYEEGVYLGYLLAEKSIIPWIGTTGLALLYILLTLIALATLIPGAAWLGLGRALRNSFAKRKIPPSTEKKSPFGRSKGHVKQTPPPAPQNKATAPPTSEPASQKEVTEPQAVELNLELYDRDFVKIPHGLFKEQTTFNTSLPTGTRRQEIIDAFASFDIAIDIGQIRRGPSFEQYEILPCKGVRVASIRGIVDDVSMQLKTKANINKQAGRSLSLEVPLADRQVIPCGYLLEDTADDELRIPIAVGVDASFQPFSIDLVDMPHLLIAGTTGSGKSVFLKTLLTSIIYHLTPNEARLVLVDPKRVEFGVFASSRFCACPIATEFAQVPHVFDALIEEMEARYALLEGHGVSDIQQYNEDVKPDQRKPYIIVVVDEFADLILQDVPRFEESVIRLAQKARASGIHLVLATQRPSADVIKGLIKTNIPGRIALSVSSRIDSKIILDQHGAENLIGNGDLICICPSFRDGIRLQGPFVTKKEIQKIIKAKS